MAGNLRRKLVKALSTSEVNIVVFFLQRHRIIFIENRNNIFISRAAVTL